MCAPSPPAAPDPNAVASAQSQYNEKAARTTARLNRYNTVTPYGTQTWTQSGTTTPDYDAYNKALTAYNATPSYGSFNPVAGVWMDEHGRYTSDPNQIVNARGPAPKLEDFRMPSDEWTTTLSVAPEVQRQIDEQQRIASNLTRVAGDQLGRVESTINQPMSLYGLPDRVSSVNQTMPWAGGIADAGAIQRSVGANDFSADRRRVEDAIFSRLNEQIDRDRETMRANSIVRGLNPTTEAYGRESDQFNRQATDARMQAILAGGQEQSRLFGLDLSKGQFANQAQAQQFGQNAASAQFTNAERQQQLQEMLANANLSNSQRQAALQELLAMRLNPLNELNALRTGTQVQVPGLTPSAPVNVAPANYMGASQYAYGQQVNNANAEAAANANMLGGLFGIGMGVAGLPMAGGSSLGGAALSRLFGL